MKKMKLDVFIKEKKKLGIELQQFSASEEVQLEPLSRLEHQECQLTTLLAKLKKTESVFESSLQGIILILGVTTSIRYVCFLH